MSRGSWKTRIRRYGIKIFNWEYWPMHMVYIPNYLHFTWLCIRSGWKYFFSAADPNIENGGFLMESKKLIYDSLPEGYYPRTLLFPAHTPPALVLKTIAENGFSYPLISKPDIGMRGLAAKKLEGAEDVHQFIPAYSIPFLIQEFVPWKLEAGIFYYRYPDQPKGSISGIVTKEFMQVTGDGTKTLRSLILENPRYFLQLNALEKEYGDAMEDILPTGQTLELLPYGNHARGSLFRDDSHRINPDLIRIVDAFCQQVPEFYFGRLDIRFNSWEELANGKNFSVIELNGVGSEPTHMYDPKHSLFFAWREIAKHHRILYRIAHQNKKRGFRFMTWSEGQAMFRASRNYTRQLVTVHESLIDRNR